MLLDVTAFLATSSTLGTVAEAFSVPENSSITIVAPAALSVEQAAWSRALDAAPAGSPDPIIGPQPGTARVSAAKLPTLRGVELLDQLALLNGTELGRFVTKHPDAIAALIANPPSAASMAATWANWPEAERIRMLKKAPQLIGSAEGVPYEVRDLANRSYLSVAEASIRDQLSGKLSGNVGRATKDDLTKQLHMLEQVRSALKVGSSGNSRALISLDSTGEGRAVIAIGDVSTADYVDYLIPGMFSDVDTQIVSFAESSDTIATQQQAWLKKLNPGVAESALPTVATFAWIGYHTPNIVNVASMQLAREGQRSLTTSLAGLRAERAAEAGGTQPYVAILAHSYGTTAAMLALQDDDVSVDALAIVGSPGSPARTASQLKVANGNVWVGAGDTDPVPQTGIFGSQPTSEAYGAHRFGVDGGTDPITGKSMDAVVGHNGYFVDGTESLRNMVLIGIGRGDLVLGLDGQSALSLGKSRASVPHRPQL